MTIIGPLIESSDEFSTAAHERFRRTWSDEDSRYELSNWKRPGHARRFDERRDTVGQRLRFLHRASGRPAPDHSATVLDWGCGGGASLLAAAPMARRLIAVDLVPANVAESERQLQTSAFAETVELSTVTVGPDPVDVAARIDAPIDMFISHAVFPHVPSRAYGEAVLRLAHAVLRPGGLGYVQIRYDDGMPRFASRDWRNYETDFVRATAWPIDVFWEMTESTGLEVLCVGNINRGAHFAAFYLRKPSV